MSYTTDLQATARAQALVAYMQAHHRRPAWASDTDMVTGSYCQWPRVLEAA